MQVLSAWSLPLERKDLSHTALPTPNASPGTTCWSPDFFVHWLSSYGAPIRLNFVPVILALGADRVEDGVNMRVKEEEKG